MKCRLSVAQKTIRDGASDQCLHLRPLSTLLLALPKYWLSPKSWTLRISLHFFLSLNPCIFNPSFFLLGIFYVDY